MKKFLLLVIIILAVFIYFNRQRIYLRDPLANVTRNGVKEDGAQVFINQSNEILIHNENAPAYVLIVQHGQHIGTPKDLTCMHWMACMADADVATLIDPMKLEVGEMNGKFVEFRDQKNRAVRVTLR